jgi:lysyl-tRNA synthetase class II
VTAPSAAALATTLRTHLGGALRRADVGARVTLGGWVHRSRDLGGLVFVSLRDREGIVQVSFNPDWTAPDVIAAAAAVGVESVVLIEGTVHARPDDQHNPEMATGEIEVRATGLKVVGPAETPAIPVAMGKDAKPPAEELRLRHRVLDLRKPELQHALMLRHRLAQVTRNYLSGLGYLEIETPSSPSRRRKARATSSCRAACTPGSSTRCRSRRRSTSSCSCAAGSTGTSRSRAASATRICAPTGSSSSRRSTSKPRSSAARISW